MPNKYILLHFTKIKSHGTVKVKYSLNYYNSTLNMKSLEYQPCHHNILNKMKIAFNSIIKFTE